MVIYCDMDLLTLYCMLLLVLSASGYTDHLEMNILGYIIGGCIGSMVREELVPSFLL